ncbi:hypothetical protein Syun_022739 [Stephania yunnanensis]|uniref:Uncharacterized protein n=1 Tax=Stephania yunnanensis TaxID=152371 RepID=A0AAP0FE31_9MAGN
MEGLPSRIKRVRALGFGGLAQTFSHSKEAVTAYLLRRSPSGVCAVSCREEERRRGERDGMRSVSRKRRRDWIETENGFRFDLETDQKRNKFLSALRGGDGKYYARGGRATKGSFSQRDWRGGHGSEQGRQHDVTVQTPVHEFYDSGSKATPRKSLVKKSGDRERTPDFGIEDEEPAFMRDEFDKKFDKGGKMSSKGGSLSAIYPGRDREMKELWDTVAGGFEDDQEGVRTMDDDNFIDDTLEWIRWPCTGSDNEGFIGDAPQLEKGHGIRESLDILLGKAASYNPQAKVLWLRDAKEKWLAGEVDTTRAILGQAYAAITSVKINVKHLVPYYGDTSDDDNSRANSVHPGENDEVQELACKSLIG